MGVLERRYAPTSLLQHSRGGGRQYSAQIQPTSAGSPASGAGASAQRANASPLLGEAYGGGRRKYAVFDGELAEALHPGAFIRPEFVADGMIQVLQADFVRKS